MELMRYFLSTYAIKGPPFHGLWPHKQNSYTKLYMYDAAQYIDEGHRPSMALCSVHPSCRIGQGHLWLRHAPSSQSFVLPTWRSDGKRWSRKEKDLKVKVDPKFAWASFTYVCNNIKSLISIFFKGSTAAPTCPNTRWERAVKRSSPSTSTWPTTPSKWGSSGRTRRAGSSGGTRPRARSSSGGRGCQGRRSARVSDVHAVRVETLGYGKSVHVTENHVSLYLNLKLH